MDREADSGCLATSSSRRPLEGGRIFAVLSAFGGILTCWGATSRWIRVYPSTVGFERSVLLRPLGGPSPTLARGALLGGVAIVILAGCFVVMSGTSSRRWIAVSIVVIAMLVALAFHNLRLEDPLSFVPLQLRGGLVPCDPRRPVLPCLIVQSQAEKIEWGGWVAVFWGILAVIRTRSQRRDRSAEIASGVRGWITRERSASDLRLLFWMVAVTAVAAILLYVGFFILYGMFAGDPP